MDKDRLRVIDGNGENDRASIEQAMVSALMRNDKAEFDRLRDKVKSGVWPAWYMMRQAASFC